ncbi:Diaminopimelate decarboxylase [hydrothermal vent metagenome]|uniref:diaminopimelate decarboxylase n=1 Tax=hydrothermal vent metagenome TaxID=652676 RepID=A0A3B0XKW4_9ZZZZ
MDHFEYKNNQLYAENAQLSAIAAEHGTPAYVYSRATFVRHWQAFDQAFGSHPHLICYAVKANSNIAVLNLLAGMGSGFDIVSLGELERVLKAGGDAGKVVFSGVGKKPSEIRRALEVGIRCFNVESTAELQLINEMAAEMGRVAPVSLRVNPNVDAGTHPYISTGLKENKFGIAHENVLDVYQQAQAMSNIAVQGIDCHIGSQLTEITPFVDALKRVLELVDQLEASGIALQHMDLGGGLGICYRHEKPPLPAEQIAALLAVIADRGIEILIEPGRAIAGNAGVLLTEVLYLKHNKDKNFAIIDAAMNDLMRPALYGAWQDIVALQPREGESKTYDVVGPVCETGDFLGKQRQLCLQAGDILAVKSAGAYGFTMSSNYNTRPRAVEIMVDGENVHVIRQRETLEQLLQGECLLPPKA